MVSVLGVCAWAGIKPATDAANAVMNKAIDFMLRNLVEDDAYEELCKSEEVC